MPRAGRHGQMLWRSTNARSCQHGLSAPWNRRHQQLAACLTCRLHPNEGTTRGWWRPSWTASRDGKRPPVNTSGEPGEWPHGWQCWASSISDTFCWKNFPLSIQLQIGHTSDHIQDAMRWSPSPMLPRPRSARSRHTCSACCSWSDCNCHCQSQRRRVPQCPRRPRAPHSSLHAQWTREKACHSDRTRADPCVSRSKAHAQDVPCFGGAQLAVDITLRSVLTRAGEPQCNAADIDGAVLINARRDKEAKYPELVASGRCKIVVGIETGGRWSEGAVDFLRQLSTSKAQEVPSFMRMSVSLAWERRWTRMLSVVCATAFTASQVEPDRHCESMLDRRRSTPCRPVVA